MDIASRRGSEQLRRRLIRAFIWFSLAIMPASVRQIEGTGESPYAIVQDRTGLLPDIDQLVASLASRS